MGYPPTFINKFLIPTGKKKTTQFLKKSLETKICFLKTKIYS